MPENQGIDNAQENSGRMKVLQATPYKDGFIYVRQFDADLFVWDAVWGGQLYSSYMVITPEKDEDGNYKPISESILQEVRDMCYAGAGATIDTLRGDELSQQDKDIVNLVESKREEVENSEK